MGRQRGHAIGSVMTDYLIVTREQNGKLNRIAHGGKVQSAFAGRSNNSNIGQFQL